MASRTVSAVPSAVLSSAVLQRLAEACRKAGMAWPHRAIARDCMGLPPAVPNKTASLYRAGNTALHCSLKIIKPGRLVAYAVAAHIHMRSDPSLGLDGGRALVYFCFVYHSCMHNSVI